MIKLFLSFSLLFLAQFCVGQFISTEVGTLPERVSNNAVCEGYIQEVPYLFSFGGIDSTKIYSGIHLRSFRYNLETGVAERIDDLPDDLGKIAAAASRINNIIYIAGGYNVFSNNTEKTTNKMHRYDIENNQFLPDATPIPVPTDDHVQAVWRDSLIYLITGWNDTANIPNVQIYNPINDEWMEGTPVPNLNTYKSFGASGLISGDTIYYFGGASSSGNFGIQNKLRIGVINPTQPSEISWSLKTPDIYAVGYRMATTQVNNELHWLGGSNKTYNYNGIAYDGSGVVAPNNRDLYLTPNELTWIEKGPIEIPMDLRGIANVSNNIKYTAGGMLENREVTNKIYKLEWMKPTSSHDAIEMVKIRLSPNPFIDHLQITSSEKIIHLNFYDRHGSFISSQSADLNRLEVDTNHLLPGIYFLQIQTTSQTITKKIVKLAY